MAGTKFDRGSQDVGNILALEHVNVRIPDQGLATLFYVVGLGLTRDPYLMVGLDNMWANAGQQQFHLPTAAPQVLRGCVGLVVPDLEALQARLGSVRDKLAGTRFDYAVENKHVAVTCPWGNRIRCHAPAPEFGDLTLGIPYVEFPVEAGCAKGIAAFYRTVFKAPATVTPDGGGALARVQVGSAPLARGARLDHRREQRYPVPVHRDRGSRVGASALHDRARGAVRHAPDVPAPADQPQPGPAAGDVRPRARRVRPRAQLVPPG